ncbi:MAG: protein kinase [Pirellulaceae bacterium]
MASLSPVASADAFVEALEKSNLLSADEVAKAREMSVASGDPKVLARDLVKNGVLTRWQAGQLLHGYYLLMVGKYKLLDQLGAGEMGRVYLAEHAQMGRRHALKILARRHAAQPEVLQRFLADAERVCALDHRNLSHIYDVNQEGDRYFVVMEYVEGVDLQNTLATAGKLPLASALDYIRQAAEGLEHAHAAGVFHGDLKPSNLLVDATGTVKITDIGQARLATPPPAGTVEETSEMAALAAGVYHAPEQRLGQSAADARSDVYSLGNVLCCLLGGKPALDAQSAAQQLAALPEVPAEVAGLCIRMMTENPDERPQSMRQVREELFALGEIATAHPAAAELPKPKTKAVAPASALVSALADQPAAPAVKGKRPPVAKALDDAAADEEVIVANAADGTVKSAQAKPTEDDADPFAGFAIQTKGRARSSKPPAKSSPSVEEPAALVATAEEAATVAPAWRSNLPLILGTAIGGGVLVLGAFAVAIVLAFRWGAGQGQTAVADAATATQKAAEMGRPAEPASLEANPESTPEVNQETNPAVPVAPTTNLKPVATEAAPPAEPLPAPAAAPISPMPMPAPEPAPEPAAPAPEAKPAEPAKVEPAKAEPVKPAPAKPAPAKPAPPPNPFEGFPATVSLPALPANNSEPSAEALAPLVLGPCVVDEKALVIARLKGGEGVVKGGKLKFEMNAAQDGTALRDWEISLAGGDAPVVVALLSAKDNQLSFQWTAAAAKQEAAPLLCNVALEFSAGPGSHEVVLRTLQTGPPLVFDVEKPASVRWALESLPDPQKVFLEVTGVTGGEVKHKADNLQMEAVDTNFVWTGAAEEALILGLKLTSSINARGIEVKSSPQIKMSGMTKPVTIQKRKLNAAANDIQQQRAMLMNNLQAIGDKKDKGRIDQQRNLANAALEKVNQAAGELEQLAALMTDLHEKGQVHFRVYYDTGEGQIDLLVTEAGAAAEGQPEQPAKREAKK